MWGYYIEYCMADFVNTDNGKLLMISDLEGCAEFDNANSDIDPTDPTKKMKVKQTTVLCDKTTFDSFDKFLKKNKNNKIAFLGDYFDKGPHVITSINGIVKLFEDNPDKVHIILGNRDVNKLRLIYELNDLQPQTPPPTPIENPFFQNEVIQDIIKEKGPFEKLKLILKNTMGAGAPLYDTNKEIGLQIKQIGDTGDNKEDDDKYLAKILVSVFNKDVANAISDRAIDEYDNLFIENCRKLFINAKIVHYDSDFKVLLSHAGGFTNTGSHILSDISYYENIINEMVEIKAENYFIRILETQKQLIKPVINIEKMQEKKLSEVLKFHNDLLTNSLKFDDKLLPSKEYILLQAMGLNGSDYYSFIASCGLNGGCELKFNKNQELLTKMKDNDIKFVASGHQPHCTTVPLIYKQDDIVFIANDTSNGYRPEDPEELLKLENIPLSYIEENTEGTTFGCGVCAINNNGVLIKGNDPNNIKALSKDGKNPDYYNNLIKSYDDIGEIIPASEINNILNVDQTGKFKPLLIIGGKRKSKKHRYTKNQKKHSNKTKKYRKSKKTCHHCKRH